MLLHGMLQASLPMFLHTLAGDMDSAQPEVLDFYRQHGAEVIDLAEDQDSTDLHKCIAYIEKRFSEAELRRLTILVLGAFPPDPESCWAEA